MFSKKLLDWYEENGRRLPWRGIDNAYYIWLSEIILQQTRIEQGRDYYDHFIHTYPTVIDLANASEEQVLKSWQGLGYYSRARNLHAAAKYIANELNGEFPNTYEGILKLKGVGKYTAAAIASFAFKLPHPVIDGNVYRLISRLYGIYTPIGTDQAYREFEQILLHLIDRERPDMFNQAIMDFGSLYCKPTGCDCEHCIFGIECVAKREDKVALLPVKPQKVIVKERYFYYIDIRWEGYRLMQQRTCKDIWQGLFELPLLETSEKLTEAEEEEVLRSKLAEWVGAVPVSLVKGPIMKHQLTHRTICAYFWEAKYDGRPAKWPENMQALSEEETKKRPVSRLIDRYLMKL